MIIKDSKGTETKTTLAVLVFETNKMKNKNDYCGFSQQQ